MLSETLQHGLRNYSIGDKVRELRLRKKMGLVELGRHTGLSAALLSKIERGRLFPTLPTLLRIAMVFNVSLEHFFSEQRNHVFALIRRAERLSFHENMGGDEPIFSFECLDFKVENRRINAYHACFNRSDSKRLLTHQHNGYELLYLMSGELKLSVSDEMNVLQPGDSVYFDSSVKHGYQAAGSELCTAIVMTIV